MEVDEPNENTSAERDSESLSEPFEDVAGLFDESFTRESNARSSTSTLGSGTSSAAVSSEKSRTSQDGKRPPLSTGRGTAGSKRKRGPGFAENSPPRSTLGSDDERSHDGGRPRPKRATTRVKS